MKTRIIAVALFLAIAMPAYAQPAGPAPEGEVKKYTFSTSKIFPGTVRDYWVYVPKQYDPAKPPCVYVNQDGVLFNAPAVFDELIHKKDMPVTIGVFVMPGVVKAPNDKALDRINRSFEFDSLGDNYVRFLLDELLPDVETKKTADGKPIKLSKSGNDRSIGGASSGAICAFTAAWERPDAFSRVFSAIGTYVGLRGGNNYPTLIRKYEPKPIRVFLQDGSGDLDIYGGDWWMMANQEMERALKVSGYEVNHEWDEGGHDAKHATKIFPQAMKWLWKDWPTPVKAGAGSKEMKEVLQEGEGWKVAVKDSKGIAKMATNRKGEVFCSEVFPRNKVYKIDNDGKVTEFLPGPDKAPIWAFGPDGLRYSSSGSGPIIAWDEKGKDTRVYNKANCIDLIVDYKGGIFLIDASRPKAGRDMLYIAPNGKIQVTVDKEWSFSPSHIALSPDQTLMYVHDGRSHWIYSYQIQPGGKLTHKQEYNHLHVPDDADDSGTGGICVDRDRRLYVATRLGIQICDQAGRVNCIVPVPSGQPTGLCFGGANFDTLFVTCGDKIYSRKLKTRGANAFEPPIKPNPPPP
ncbi:MAG TPA: SMP-30/gluconolactonase/LRE family protein [Gemmataceae bacterium]|nr:SMP-30/gluconolactonase/LRE family protein [Gemmataceae bacterium]